MLNKESKIYVAGHTGLVGSAIVRKLRVAGINNLILKTRQELDLFNQQAVEAFFVSAKPDIVVLCAARVGGIKANIDFAADFLYENIQIQNNVIWNALKNKVSKLLFLSSSCIYPRNCLQPMKEDYFLKGRPEPTNEGYAIAKIAGMKMCEKIYEQYGNKFISCMPTNIYGEHDNFDPNSSHVIPAMIRKMHKAKMKKEGEVVIWGSGDSKREFLYVDDLADAVLWMLQNYNEQEFLNIGTGRDISIKELAFLIKDVVEYEGNLIFDSSKPDGMPKKLLDVSKINHLGWKYNISLKIGLQKTYKWYLNNYDK